MSSVISKPDRLPVESLLLDVADVLRRRSTWIQP